MTVSVVTSNRIQKLHQLVQPVSPLQASDKLGSLLLCRALK